MKVATQDLEYGSRSAMMTIHGEDWAVGGALQLDNHGAIVLTDPIKFKFPKINLQNALGNTMPTIRITLDDGRSTDRKRAVAKAVTDAIVSTLGGEPDWVTIIFEDVAREDWSIGGQLQLDRKGALKPGEHD